MTQPRVVQCDPWLEPFTDNIWQRIHYTQERRRFFCGEQSLTEFASGALFYGVSIVDQQYNFREFLPNASAVYLLCDANAWSADETYAFKRKDDIGNWSFTLPCAHLPEGSMYRLLVEWPGGSGERIPAFAQRVVQSDSGSFNAQIYTTHHSYQWRVPNFKPASEAPIIYECHIGMAQEKEAVGSFAEFEACILPRIKAAGYNAIQIMALMEHPYYGSFGYQVSSFFALSSRFGTPEEFMSLVDACHEAGIAVIMDLIHSHAVKNQVEGIGLQDGTESLYFHPGDKGRHPAWDSRCFDYGKPETVHFLLSNCRYWLETFHLDGFRFDGVTSMLYHHHGLGVDFDHYGKYYNEDVDKDAVTYLSLANQLIHELNPAALSIAEDMSGMPGMGMAIDEGGLGFDYRLAMGLPDMWTELIDDRRDEDWHVHDIFDRIASRRGDIKTIAYAESHDQALVGDKCISFRLMDKEMYEAMALGIDNMIVERGIALHKIIRLLTLSIGGEAYLNFMGNEFGHPEWIDFPREGNDWSYRYARRQWHLVDDQDLRYACLARFDQAMLKACASNLGQSHAEIIAEHVADRWLAYRFGDLLVAVNLHNQKSQVDLRIPVPAHTAYELVLSSDEQAFDGLDRVCSGSQYPLLVNDQAIAVYLPTRSALVFRPCSKSV